MSEVQIKKIIQKYVSRLLIPAVIGFFVADVLSQYLFDKSLPPLLAFIFSFSLAMYVMQKVLVEVLVKQKS